MALLKPARPLSLIAAGRIFVIFVFLFTGAVALFSHSFLTKIEADAADIQDQQIPAVLAQNRNALKIEKLVSLTRSAFLARDSVMERQIQLQVRILSQSFALDGDNVLTQGATQMADGISRIIAARVEEREAGGDGLVTPATANADAVAAYQQTMDLAEGLANNLSTGTARVADKISTDIQFTAGAIRQAWWIILGVPLVATLLLFWFFRAQVVRPIDITVQRLEAIKNRAGTGLGTKKAWFSDLRQIELAVSEFAQVSEELHVKNEMLLLLSDQDPLTKVGNRRHFDTTLTDLVEQHHSTGRLALLLLDLDHFKLINDQYGHQMGDACLKTVGHVLTTLCEPHSFIPARFGGEEFAVLMPGADLAEAVIFAERMRVEVSRLTIATSGDGSSVSVTTSIGVASLADVRPRSSNALIEASDRALYKAKSEGRNSVCCDRPNDIGRLRLVK
ncbi:MAG: GGDEF domain-containing protein [Candidatus Devosia phytovorans]|uniref:diguanylate cyclase n=1 Tax=Candidatus Devosia phytovorans TaxID=3121372 RepID=A0AAJ5VR60_9HYPH|nr:GGDEF domain-containing protein [Devosia sp.]WEK03236.1 MAG: GGDEF domain-containing protein [Devosia sp.]